MDASFGNILLESQLEPILMAMRARRALCRCLLAKACQDFKQTIPINHGLIAPVPTWGGKPTSFEPEPWHGPFPYPYQDDFLKQVRWRIVKLISVGEEGVARRRWIRQYKSEWPGKDNPPTKTWLIEAKLNATQQEDYYYFWNYIHKLYGHYLELGEFTRTLIASAHDRDQIFADMLKSLRVVMPATPRTTAASSSASPAPEDVIVEGVEEDREDEDEDVAPAPLQRPA